MIFSIIRRYAYCVEMPEGQKKYEYEARCEHQPAEAAHPDTPMLCQRRVLCVSIDHTQEHTDCKNLKVFPPIAIDERNKTSRDGMRNQKVQLWGMGNKQTPESGKKSQSAHIEKP